MTDFSAMLQPDRGQDATLITLVDKAGYDAWLSAQPPRVRTVVVAQNIRPDAWVYVILPGDKPEQWSVMAVVTNTELLTSWCLAKIASVLPAGTYRLDGDKAPGAAAYGWMMAQHRFDRFKSKRATDTVPRILLTNEPARIDGLVREAEATALVRDLVDTPASDLGPAELTDIAVGIAKAHGAKAVVIKGDALVTGFPLVHAVGKAASRERAPRLVHFEWGDPRHPRVAVVGKGVTFDSGGLDIKPASGMAMMKKDMGGAAHALALAQLIMAGNLPVRLHCIVAAVENSISGDAMRPGDIYPSRNGLTVEIDNTDAEGRLILADALTLAVESAPELILDYATLTGAARVALGPDLPALFARDDDLAFALSTGGHGVDDHLWRLPLWPGYDHMLKGDRGDLTNSPAGGFAGAVTAALFLARFVPDTILWAHFDTFAWRPAAYPGRPKEIGRAHV